MQLWYKLYCMNGKIEPFQSHGIGLYGMRPAESVSPAPTLSICKGRNKLVPPVPSWRQEPGQHPTVLYSREAFPFCP